MIMEENIFYANEISHQQQVLENLEEKKKNIDNILNIKYSVDPRIKIIQLKAEKTFAEKNEMFKKSIDENLKSTIFEENYGYEIDDNAKVNEETALYAPEENRYQELQVPYNLNNNGMLFEQEHSDPKKIFSHDSKNCFSKP